MLSYFLLHKEGENPQQPQRSVPHRNNKHSCWWLLMDNTCFLKKKTARPLPGYKQYQYLSETLEFNVAYLQKSLQKQTDKKMQPVLHSSPLIVTLTVQCSEGRLPLSLKYSLYLIHMDPVTLESIRPLFVKVAENLRYENKKALVRTWRETEKCFTAMPRCPQMLQSEKTVTKCNTNCEKKHVICGNQ